MPRWASVTDSLSRILTLSCTEPVPDGFLTALRRIRPPSIAKKDAPRRSSLPPKVRVRKRRVVVDTSVLVAGILGFREPFVLGRNPSADVLHRRAQKNHFVWLITEDILDEYNQILKRVKERLPSENAGLSSKCFAERRSSILSLKSHPQLQRGCTEGSLSRRQSRRTTGFDTAPPELKGHACTPLHKAVFGRA